jgi:hypothetical protein
MALIGRWNWWMPGWARWLLRIEQRGEQAMSVQNQSSARRAGTVSTAGLSRLRFANLAVLILVLIEYGFGMYVNLYARRWGVAILSVIGVFAMIFASVAGTTFVRTGDDADSMAMAVMAGVAALCYALNLYSLRPGTARG